MIETRDDSIEEKIDTLTAYVRELEIRLETTEQERAGALAWGQKNCELKEELEVVFADTMEKLTRAESALERERGVRFDVEQHRRAWEREKEAHWATARERDDLRAAVHVRAEEAELQRTIADIIRARRNQYVGSVAALVVAALDGKFSHESTLRSLQRLALGEMNESPALEPPRWALAQMEEVAMYRKRAQSAEDARATAEAIIAEVATLDPSAGGAPEMHGAAYLAEARRRLDARAQALLAGGAPC